MPDADDQSWNTQQITQLFTELKQLQDRVASLETMQAQHEGDLVRLTYLGNRVVKIINLQLSGMQSPQIADLKQAMNAWKLATSPE